MESLSRQRLIPSEIIVIDNDSYDQTSGVISIFCKKGLQIRRVLEKKIGYPMVYNRGLSEARSSWVAFIDDDCVADKTWYSSICAAIQKRKCAAIIGTCLTIDTNSIYSLATWSFDQIWKKAAIDSTDQISDLEILDNKNIAYNLDFLKKNRIKFNEKPIETGESGAAEDADLGLQIAAVGGIAWFEPKIIVAHHDPTNFLWYLKKIASSTVAVQSLNLRWKDNRAYTYQTIETPRKRLLSQFFQTAQEYHLSFIRSIALALILLIGISCHKIIVVCLKIKKYFGKQS